MIHVKLFEEFNLYSIKKLVDKLRIYAEASDVATSVSSIKDHDSKLSFSIFTNLPGDKFDGNKSFVITVSREGITVETFIENKSEIKVSLEPAGENDIHTILINFIEATSLYNDGIIEAIVDAHKNVNTPSDIKKILSDDNIEQTKK